MGAFFLGHSLRFGQSRFNSVGWGAKYALLAQLLQIFQAEFGEIRYNSLCIQLVGTV